MEDLHNYFFDAARVETVNNIVESNLPTTLGGCSVDHVPLPCTDSPAFPISLAGDAIEMDYLSGLDTLKVTKLSWRCDFLTDDEIDGKVWYIEIDGDIGELVLSVSRRKTFTDSPHVAVKQTNIQFHMVARLGCDDPAKLQILLAPQTDSLSLSGLQISLDTLGVQALPSLPSLPGEGLDVSEEVAQVLKSKVQGLTLERPDEFKELEDTICPWMN